MTYRSKGIISGHELNYLNLDQPRHPQKSDGHSVEFRGTCHPVTILIGGSAISISNSWTGGNWNVRAIRGQES